ncbi:acyl-CoA dehydrogenase family protein [Pseudomonas sp. GV085]|uniref:acyl-CoA dehydrogenase family protein n=1 Tax=Pseudomonas sp. GV085 TaxID=2135756 RepID=UPI000D392033|nr:acyl-CoA dehydrogenase family protein [Pseudomonas sp. GV085]PTR23789.1 alkylation response protein AidB-like acyl-CoA dehydrogenase [Pseudomonas sp. GV085]
MDYRDTPEEAKFRLELREWFKHNTPANWREITDPQGLRALSKSWHKALYASGYIGLNWPKEYGGQGLSATFDAILNDEAGRADSPRLPAMVNYLGRAIFTYGTEEQKQHFLPTLLSGEVQWCQGFSEPGAGSDLASLRTRAEQDGDHYVVNGQKMWTSGALQADWCLLLARTDSNAAKHKGISCLLTPLDAPGITVKPIVLHSGEPETAEVFFDDVRIPASQRIGAPGDGWRIAMTTVSYERGASDTGSISALRRQLREIEQIAAERGLLADTSTRHKLARAHVDIEALSLNVAQQLSLRLAGRDPGPEGSVGKLLWSKAAQYTLHVALDVLGADALTGNAPRWLAEYFTSRPVSVYGGSSQIQKNILARMLDMPR